MLNELVERSGSLDSYLKKYAVGGKGSDDVISCGIDYTNNVLYYMRCFTYLYKSIIWHHAILLQHFLF